MAPTPELRDSPAVVGHPVVPLGSLQDSRDVIEAGIAHDPFERLRTDRAFSDQLVPVPPGPERGAGIVHVDAVQVFKS
jgi:hypothetical protein